MDQLPTTENIYAYQKSFAAEYYIQNEIETVMRNNMDNMGTWTKRKGKNFIWISQMLHKTLQLTCIHSSDLKK